MNISAKTITTLSSREFNQDTGRAKRATEKGPVFITTRGKPSHVLMTIEDFRRLEQKKPKNLVEALADDSPEADFDWEPPRLTGNSLKIPDFE